MRWDGGSSGNGMPRRVGGGRDVEHPLPRGREGGEGVARRKKPSKKLPREATSRAVRQS